MHAAWQVWDVNKPAPRDFGGPFELVLALNAIHACNNIAGTLTEPYHKHVYACSNACHIKSRAAHRMRALQRWAAFAPQSFESDVQSPCQDGGPRRYPVYESHVYDDTCWGPRSSRFSSFGEWRWLLAAETLENVVEQIADGGFLLLCEAARPWTCLLWGLDARSWAFTDERDYGLWNSCARWHALLAAAGLDMVACNKCA